MGLATQGGRIGLRSPRAENQAVQRVWQVPHVPADWGPTEVRTVLAAAFEKITLINWRRHDQEYTYRFKGTCKMGDRDLVPLVASVADANGVTCDLTMWAAIAPTKVAVTTRRTVRREAIPCVELEASILQPKPVKVNVPAELDDSGKEVSCGPAPRSAEAVPASSHGSGWGMFLSCCRSGLKVALRLQAYRVLPSAIEGAGRRPPQEVCC